MNKIARHPSTVIAPLPAAMVSCGSTPEDYNIITIAWTGTVCSTPPMCYVSIRPERYSHKIITKTKEFVINLVPEKLVKEMDWCGVNSGRNYNKFKEPGLTPVNGQKVKAPLIMESPVNIECMVKDIISLGSHDMFLSEIVAVNTDEGYEFDNSLVSYNNGKYYKLGEYLGYYGFSKK